MHPRLRTAAGALASLTVLLSPLTALAGDVYQLLSTDAVEKLLGAPDTKIYDVNVDELWAKHHLPGAIHVGAKDLETLLPQDKGTRLVFYCSGPK